MNPRLIQRAPAALGAWQDQFASALRQNLERSDPELAEVVSLASEILAMERQPGGALDPHTPSTFRISDLRRPMQGYLFYRRHPLLVCAIPVGVLALAFFLGRQTAH